jgi:small subunit ribosomal protein S6
MNLECNNETLEELEHGFKFNDAVLRHLTVKMSAAMTGPSPMMKEEKSRSLTQGQGGSRQASAAPAQPRRHRPASPAAPPAAPSSERTPA